MRREAHPLEPLGVVQQLGERAPQGAGVPGRDADSLSRPVSTARAPEGP